MTCLRRYTSKLKPKFFSDYNITDPRLPSGLCRPCRSKLHRVAEGQRQNSFNLDHFNSLAENTRRRSPRKECEQCDAKCLVCSIAKANGQAAKKIHFKLQNAQKADPPLDQSLSYTTYAENVCRPDIGGVLMFAPTIPCFITFSTVYRTTFKKGIIIIIINTFLSVLHKSVLIIILSSIKVLKCKIVLAWLFDWFWVDCLTCHTWCRQK